MRYQEDLQVAVRERLRRLMTAHWEDFDRQLGFAAAWIKSQPALMAILAAAQRVEPDLDHEAWAEQLINGHQLTWPNETEEGQADLIWTLIQGLVTSGTSGEFRNMMFGFGSHLDEATREMVDRVFAPLFDFLTEHVGKGSAVLYTLERYVRRLEWFERDRLYARFLEQTSRGEEVYDRDLREFLFSEGVNMPFSQAKSASGLSDVLSDLDTEDPLVCEVKLFDAGDHGMRNISAGVNQVTHYAQDYSKTNAYLVIINLSGRALELPTDGESGIWPRYIDLAGVRVYLISVRARPPESASKLGKASPVTVSRDDLVNPDSND